jgi:centromere DNA-binding complex CBF3 subunit-like protein
MKQRMHLTGETDSRSPAEMQWILDLHAFAPKVSILLRQCQSSCDKIRPFCFSRLNSFHKRKLNEGFFGFRDVPCFFSDSPSCSLSLFPLYRGFHDFVSMKDEGPTPCRPMLLIMNSGKTNQFNKLEYGVVARHRNLSHCTMSALAFYPFFRWQIMQEVPTFRWCQDWYRIHVLKGANPQAEICYDTQYDWTTKLFDQAGLHCLKKTHVQGSFDFVLFIGRFDVFSRSFLLGCNSCNCARVCACSPFRRFR